MQLATASQEAQSAQQLQAQQRQQVNQLETQLQQVTHAKINLQESFSAQHTENSQLKADSDKQEEELKGLRQQLVDTHAASEKLRGDLQTRISELTAQNSELSSQTRNLQQQQSSQTLELTARNSGLMTQLTLQQQQHADALQRATSEISSQLQAQLTATKQQLKTVSNKLHAAEQHLSAQEQSLSEAESRALRADWLMKKSEQRRVGLESDKRRLQSLAREHETEVHDQRCQSLPACTDQL